MLNNDHFQNDLDCFQKLQDFDAEITPPIIQRHDVYTKALRAVREHEALTHFENMEDAPRRIKHGGCVIALDRERQPDRPGTVRKPGIRRQRQGSFTKRRWSTV